MDINALILQHGHERFKADTHDELGGVMYVDGYKIHVRQDDVSLADGMLLSECHPLINHLQKVQKN
jgi:hypothetical protein